jgi:type II secretory pathway predicted ATPase ExeA
LAALGTRIRLRLPLEPLHRDHLIDYMHHALEQGINRDTPYLFS